jgi:hypothetical protein
MPDQSICLKFGSEIASAVRPRIDYALRIFAAIYGYRVVGEISEADICCVYGERTKHPPHSREFVIPARYRIRLGAEVRPILQKHLYAGEDFYLTHGLDETTGKVDWLGEIFEWLSASLEYPCKKRDAVGRLPYLETVFNRQQISPLKPHAGMLMAWMENQLQGNPESRGLPKPVSPVPGSEHAVVCSHDIDFYYTGRPAVLERLGKNLLISMLEYRDSSFFLANAKMTTKLLIGKSVGSYIPEMLDRIESLGFRSTLFAVAGGTHRRDPTYEIEQIAPELRQAVQRGFGVGVHASYNSAVGSGTLRKESETLHSVIGRKPTGSRQHWLRFDKHENLYRGLHEAGVTYDSSLGFAETCGFRNGANFAFPPYDLENERPCSFLEIPLVIMDGSLQMASGTLQRCPQEIADEIMNESRKVGWGGISILWHNPVEALQVPEKINRVFWDLAQRRHDYGETWMSGEEFVKACLDRYQQAGLLQGVGCDA